VTNTDDEATESEDGPASRVETPSGSDAVKLLLQGRTLARDLVLRRCTGSMNTSPPQH